jgi:hypothetical protein
MAQKKTGENITKGASDQDIAKGATEDAPHEHSGNVGMEEQLGHRDQDPMLKDADSDFPEPGESPEHSGEGVKKRLA